MDPNKLPCVDCITLGICKAEVLKKSTLNYFYPMTTIISKCVLLREHIIQTCPFHQLSNGHHTLYDISDEISNLFNLPPGIEVIVL